MIRINVSRADATLTETETLTEGRVGLRCAFTFGEEWNGLQKIAYFEGSDARSVAMVDGDEVEVPWECMASAGYKLNVGVRGDNASGDTVIPTVWVRAGKIVPSPDSGIPEGEEPTPSVVAQIQQAAANALLIARDVAEQAESGAFKGDKGDTGEQGPRGETGDSGVYFGSTPPTDPDVNVWIDTSGDAETDFDLFVATYAETDGGEVATAYQAGKTLMCKYNDALCPLIMVNSTTIFGDTFPVYWFGYALENGYRMLKCVGDPDSYMEQDKGWTEYYTDRGVNLPDPLMDGTASRGSSSMYARADHVHPSDTSRLAANQGVANAGKFMVVGSDGVVAPVTMSAWQGGSY